MKIVKVGVGGIGSETIYVEIQVNAKLAIRNNKSETEVCKEIIESLKNPIKTYVSEFFDKEINSVEATRR